jgi:hypothetical protein
VEAPSSGQKTEGTTNNMSNIVFDICSEDFKLDLDGLKFEYDPNEECLLQHLN